MDCSSLTHIAFAIHYVLTIVLVNESMVSFVLRRYMRGITELNVICHHINERAGRDQFSGI